MSYTQHTLFEHTMDFVQTTELHQSHAIRAIKLHPKKKTTRQCEKEKGFIAINLIHRLNSPSWERKNLCFENNDPDWRHIFIISVRFFCSARSRAPKCVCWNRKQTVPAEQNRQSRGRKASKLMNMIIYSLAFLWRCRRFRRRRCPSFTDISLHPFIELLLQEHF